MNERKTHHDRVHQSVETSELYHDGSFKEFIDVLRTLQERIDIAFSVDIDGDQFNRTDSSMQKVLIIVTILHDFMVAILDGYYFHATALFVFDNASDLGSSDPINQDAYLM